MYGNIGLINTTQNIPPSTVIPPFPAGAANNGLSVDPMTGLIVFGNDFPGVSAALLSNREVPMGAFSIIFSSNVTNALAILNPLAFSLTHPASTNGVTLSIGPTQAAVLINSDETLPGGFAPKLRLHNVTFDDVEIFNRGGICEIETAPGDVNLSLDANGGAFEMGDLAGTGNNTVLSVDDGSQQVIALANNGLRSTTTIETQDPGSGVGKWKLGDVVVAASALDATQYLEVEVNGVMLKIALIT